MNKNIDFHSYMQEVFSRNLVEEVDEKIMAEIKKEANGQFVEALTFKEVIQKVKEMEDNIDNYDNAMREV